MTLFDESPPSPREHTADDYVRAKLLVAYDGSAFHGFAINRGVATVGGALTDAIRLVTRHDVTLSVAGRTDRGVHAWGQVVSCDLPVDTDLAELMRRVNKLCEGRVVVRDISVVGPDFDARFSARSRTYRYTIVNEATTDPFLRQHAWWVETSIDLRSMQLACDPLIGEHDFASFCRRPKPNEPGGERRLVRRVLDARWTTPAAGRRGVLRFEIEAQAFCHQMVRSIVGTLVDVGTGRKRAGDMTGILRARDRSVAGEIAPPHGLCLWEVRY